MAPSKALKLLGSITLPVFTFLLISVTMHVKLVNADDENSTSVNGTIPVYPNGSNISFVNGGPTYNQELNQLKNFLYAKSMQDNETKLMENQIEKTRANLHYMNADNPYPTLNYSLALANEKKVMAWYQSGFNTKYVTNYQLNQEDKTRELLADLALYHKEGRNGLPAFTTCQAWHNCVDKPYIPTVSLEQQNEVYTNSTLGNTTDSIPINLNSIDLKPEFEKYPTGWDNSTSSVNNWSSLERYMTQNQTSIVNSTK